MKTDPIKLDGVSLETKLVGKPSIKGWFIKVIVRSSTTLDIIGRVHCETWRFAWYLGTQTEFANHHIRPVAEHVVNNLIHKVI